MSEGEVKKEVCKHNQTGFCKYGERCCKQHVNIKCNQDECKDKLCTRRHPRLCKFMYRLDIVNSKKDVLLYTKKPRLSRLLIN